MIEVPPQLGTVGGREASEPVRDVGTAGEQDVTHALAHGRHDEAGIVAAVDHHAATEVELHRVPEADPGEVSHRPRRDQKRLGRRSERPPRFREVVDADDQCRARAATPGSSLPSSHSRNAPPAVET